jgi:hypothetical protein
MLTHPLPYRISRQSCQEKQETEKFGEIERKKMPNPRGTQNHGTLQSLSLAAGLPGSIQLTVRAPSVNQRQQQRSVSVTLTHFFRIALFFPIFTGTLGREGRAWA